MEELDPMTVERARRGDRAAQDAFLRRYAGAMHGLVCRVRPPGDVDDLTQDLLSKLLHALPRFDPHGAARLTTWVFTVAHHWLLDARKRRHLSLAPLEESLSVPDPAPPADRALEQVDLARALERALAQLPEAQRRVFVLAQVHQHPLERIAAGEKVPLGTVKSRLHRARAALAHALQSANEGKEAVSDAPGRRA